jgi:hypothetical protein
MSRYETTIDLDDLQRRVLAGERSVTIGKALGISHVTARKFIERLVKHGRIRRTNAAKTFPTYELVEKPCNPQ